MPSIEWMRDELFDWLEQERLKKERSKRQKIKTPKVRRFKRPTKSSQRRVRYGQEV